MKKTRMFYLVAVFALLAVSIVMFSGIARAGAATVDGFVGVPWGASKQQVAKAMAQQGFTLVDEIKGAYGEYGVYRGTFVDQPADLAFQFGKNGLCAGQADLLGVRDKDLFIAKIVYRDIKRLLVTKYGPPDHADDSPVVGSYGEAIISIWQDLRTAGTPHAPVTIVLDAGFGRRIQTLGMPTTRELFRIGVLVSYRAEIVKDSY
ncbi:MAG: hypothetical protein ABIG61_11475 [Planctomycetota bacterium]